MNDHFGLTKKISAPLSDHFGVDHFDGKFVFVLADHFHVDHFTNHFHGRVFSPAAYHFSEGWIFGAGYFGGWII